MTETYGIVNRTDLRDTNIMSILAQTIDSLREQESILFHAIGGDVLVSKDDSQENATVYIIDKV